MLQPVSEMMEGEELTARQKDVLDAALRLLVEEGDRLTMTAVARRASCSKETLYKWFGDRDGLLTATVQWQAAKVRVPPVDRKRLDLASLRASLERFASDWLTRDFQRYLDRAQPRGGRPCRFGQARSRRHRARERPLRASAGG